MRPEWRIADGLKTLARLATACTIVTACGAPPSPEPLTARVPTIASVVSHSEAPRALLSRPTENVLANDESGREACDKRLAEAGAGPFTSLEDCDQLRQELVSIRNECDSGMEVSRSFFESEACITEVGQANLKTLLESLGPADRRRQEAAVEDFKKGESGLCSQRCGDYFRAHCEVGTASCYANLIQAATKGELEFDQGKPNTKLAAGFTGFARAVCTLPGRAWKGGRPPAGCVERALATLESCAGPIPAECTQP